MKTLFKIGAAPVNLGDDGEVSWVGEMTIDADGCPRAYGPPGTRPLDCLSNAGYPGNWWGIVTLRGKPFEQLDWDEEKWPWPGYYLSTTAYLVPGFGRFDARRYVDSEKVAFAVVPGRVRMDLPGKFLGCRTTIKDRMTGKLLECVCADVGPSRHLGEASMAAARHFGLDHSPKNGGSDDKDRWLYTMWPGVAADGFILQ